MEYWNKVIFMNENKFNILHLMDMHYLKKKKIKN